MHLRTQVVVRRDPNASRWWWVCVAPSCTAEESMGFELESHPAAMRAADAHLRALDHRAPLVKDAASTPASVSERGAAGGGR